MKYLGIEKYIGTEKICLREFANRCKMPVSTISRFVNGKTDIKKSNIDKILKVTGMTYEECFSVKTQPSIALSASAPLMQSAAQPLVVKHNYRNIKVGENTTITIDVEELKKQMQENHYKSMGIGLNYGA